MIKFSWGIFLFLIIPALVSGCKSGPESPSEKFSGITETDQDGNIISIDPEDWIDVEGLDVSPALPNPFSSNILIPFTLTYSDSTRVIVRIHSSPTQRVKLLLDSILSPGEFTILWDGRDDQRTPVAPGIYRCFIKAGNSETFGDLQLK